MTKVRTISFPVTLTPDDNGTFLVECPDIPEVITFGESVDDALYHARDALEEAIAGHLQEGLPIPVPSSGEHMVEITIDDDWARPENRKPA